MELGVYSSLKHTNLPKIPLANLEALPQKRTGLNPTSMMGIISSLS